MHRTPISLPIIVLVLAVLCLTSPRMALAATPTAILSLTPASASEVSGSVFTVDVLVNTGGQGVAAIDMYLNVPSGLTYTSYDESTSVFPSNVTSPTVVGSRLHLARATFAAGGYTSTGNAEVIRLSFTPTAAGTQSLTYDQPSSSVDDYANSTNILLSVQNGQYTVPGPVSTAQPLPQPSTAPVSTAKPTPKVAVVLPVTGTSPLIPLATVLFLGSVLYVSFRLVRRDVTL